VVSGAGGVHGLPGGREGAVAAGGDGCGGDGWCVRLRRLRPANGQTVDKIAD
jgi:hypothetical protein